MISEVYIEMNQEVPIYRKTLGAIQSLFACLRHRLRRRMVKSLLLYSKVGSQHFITKLIFFPVSKHGVTCSLMG